MSQPKERTQKVLNAIKKAVDNAPSKSFRAGDVSQTLRDGGFPLGSWEIRGEFSALESAGLISCDTGSATWQLTATGADTEKNKVVQIRRKSVSKQVSSKASQFQTEQRVQVRL